MIRHEPSPHLLEVDHISKRFPGVMALRDVHLHLKEGEVLAVVGENGAGKSTLMKILAGVLQPTAGAIRLQGRAVHFDSVHDALQQGIALIHQELNLADNLSVGANIFLGREPRRWGMIDHAAIRDRSAVVLEQIGLDVWPEVLAHTLSIGQQQMVEIAKALSIQAKILIMDEPTSSLSQREVALLFQCIDELRSQGVSIIYISHRLGEVKRLADRVEVLRDGQNAGCLDRDAITHEAMVQRMVGRDVSRFYARQPRARGQKVLQLRNLRTWAHPEHALSFSVHAGEIVGIAGLVGAGRSELLTTLFGMHVPIGGEVDVEGTTLEGGNPLEAIGAGLALVPEDRKRQGLIIELTVRENITLAGLGRARRLGAFVDWDHDRRTAAEMVRQLSIVTPNVEQVTQYLSGGNQQKVVLAKWLALAPKVLLLDEPTRGVDIGAKHEIYGLMEQLAERGVAILFVSSEMEEILGVSDRCLVMHQGRLAGELEHEAMDERSVMQLATGQTLVDTTVGEEA